MTILTKNEAPKWNIDSTFLGEAKSPFPKEFLNFAITSHLRSGSSVVVGAVEDIEHQFKVLYSQYRICMVEMGFQITEK